jgi:hypothetical protein
MRTDFTYLTCALCQQEIDVSKFYACIKADEKYLHMDCSQKVREAGKHGKRLNVTTSQFRSHGK